MVNGIIQSLRKNKNYMQIGYFILLQALRSYFRKRWGLLFRSDEKSQIVGDLDQAFSNRSVARCHWPVLMAKRPNAL